MVCLALAAYITQQAAECESKIVKATKIALTMTQSGDYNNPKWDKTKRRNADPDQGGRRHQPALPQDHAHGGRRVGQVGRLEQRDLDLGNRR
jgi:hypothetical protein